MIEKGKIVKIYTPQEVVIFNTVPSKMTFECDKFFGLLSEYLTRFFCFTHLVFPTFIILCLSPNCDCDF